MRRTRSLVVPCLAVLLTLACGDALPCRTCPAIEGSYLASWQRDSLTTSCPAGPQPQTLSFTRVASTVRTTVAGEELAGTLYDTYDFTLNGGDTTTSYSMRGRVITPTQGDGGVVRLTGSLTTRASRDGGAACDTNEKFTADKL